MKRQTPVALEDATTTALARYQREIDSLDTHTKRSAKAKAIWPSRKQNRPFDDVKAKLIQMCPGARRCGYCEDSYADEIEHIWPKDIFPDRTFVWGNYLYSCGPCNGPKNNRFAVFSGNPRTKLDLIPDTIPATGPPPGDPLLVNPRSEDPLQYLFLDIQDSFAFDPYADDENSEEYQRADYTIEILKLNQRDALITARKNAYGNYRARLTEYITKRDGRAPQAELDSLILGIQEEAHPTVWEEMKRQQATIPELKALFDQTPEALNW